MGKAARNRPGANGAHVVPAIVSPLGMGHVAAFVAWLIGTSLLLLLSALVQIPTQSTHNSR